LTVVNQNRETFDGQRLATVYRQLVLWFGAQLVVALASLIFGGVASLMMTLATIATVVALAFYAYSTADALGSSAPGLWGLAMLIPCLNAITLLVISSKATETCRAHGIEVGLLGPRL
jgi:hypothetical protein